MAISMLQMLKDMDIDVEDLDNKDDKDENAVDMKDFKMDDVPEAQRPFIKKMIDDAEAGKNAMATISLENKTLRQVVESQGKKGGDDTDDTDDKGKVDVSKQKFLSQYLLSLLPFLLHIKEEHL